MPRRAPPEPRTPARARRAPSALAPTDALLQRVNRALVARFAVQPGEHLERRVLRHRPGVERDVKVADGSLAIAQADAQQAAQVEVARDMVLRRIRRHLPARGVEQAGDRPGRCHALAVAEQPFGEAERAVEILLQQLEVAPDALAGRLAAL